ncbi:MAG: amino acid ABC transporter permease [Hyphomicrobiales bacterium]
MAVQDAIAGPPRTSLSLNDPKVRGMIFQALLVGLVAWVFYSVIQNTGANLQRQGLPFGFDVLSEPSGFSINQTLIEYDETSSYGRVYWVGLLNTLLLAGVGIIFATAVGFLVGIARLSNNWVIAKVSYVYVEAIRNIPLLLQIFIWYFGVLRLLPGKRDSADLGIFGFLNVAGLYLPKPIYGETAWMILAAFIIGIIGSILVSSWAKRRQLATGQQFPMFWTAVGLIIGLPIIAYIIGGLPISFEYPTQGNFGPRGGLRVFPEFMALLFALVMYTAAFIAEIVRAGILAVSHGQTEAANALGLRNGPTLRLVVVPQAMRVIIPPLTSQYLNITKNSSLAVAIAYPDLVSVFTGTALNQTGRAVEFVLITMLTYLTISLATSLFMNWYNNRMSLVER